LDFTEKQSTDPIIILKQSSVKERKYSELSQISDNFYQLLHVEMRKMKSKELQQITDLLHEFTRIRHAKIIQFASVMELNYTIDDRLSFEEKIFYNDIVSSSKILLKNISKI
jgi:DNA replication initiation complex subunit (GINS family)